MKESDQIYSILVIEDDPAYLNNMRLILNLEGFRVRTASNGAEALNMVRDEIPDLILCDIMMPRMDGHLFFDILKQDAIFADVAFIFVTALAEREDIRKGMSAGADDYLTKPFTLKELVAAVTGRLSRLNKIRQSADSPSLRKEIKLLCEQTTVREREVLLLVGSGATSKKIAEQLGISTRTVQTHRINLMNKLNAPNAAALAHWAFIARQIT